MSSSPELNTIDLGDGVEREIQYSISIVKGLKKRFGNIQDALSHIDDDLAAFIMVGLEAAGSQGDWTEEKISKIHFSKYVGLIEAVSTAIMGRTKAQIEASIIENEAKNEPSQLALME